MHLLYKLKRKILQALLLSKPLKFWQRYGINVTRNHYYSNTPDLNKIPDEVFSRRSELPGIDLNVHEQLELFSQFAAKYRLEYDNWRKNAENYFDFHTSQTSFRSVDAQILHCMIRHFKPKKVIEVGSGFSTLITAGALLRNRKEQEVKSNFVAVEPYPSDMLVKGVPGLDAIIDKFVQDVDIELFKSLDENDVLFLDSTHTVKINGDVNYEILELLPRLKKGVIVHVHDIFLPYEYPESWVKGGERIWLEQYLLQAFLCNNDTYKIIWMSYFMHRNYAKLLKENMDYYEEDLPFKGSIWLQKIR